MAIAVIRKDDKVLIRKFDPEANLYDEPWGLFGGVLEGRGAIDKLLNNELKKRWNMTVAIKERLTWKEKEQKVDHNGEMKQFIYLYVLCELTSGEPWPANPNEELRWVRLTKELATYEFNPPTVRIFKNLGYL